MTQSVGGEILSVEMWSLRCHGLEQCEFPGAGGNCFLLDDDEDGEEVGGVSSAYLEGNIPEVSRLSLMHLHTGCWWLLNAALSLSSSFVE